MKVNKTLQMKATMMIMNKQRLLQYQEKQDKNHFMKLKDQALDIIRINMNKLICIVKQLQCLSQSIRTRRHQQKI